MEVQRGARVCKQAGGSIANWWTERAPKGKKSGANRDIWQAQSGELLMQSPRNSPRPLSTLWRGESTPPMFRLRTRGPGVRSSVSGCRINRTVRTTHVAHPEAQHDQQNAKQNGIHADHPQQGQ